MGVGMIVLPGCLGLIEDLRERTGIHLKAADFLRRQLKKIKLSMY